MVMMLSWDNTKDAIACKNTHSNNHHWSDQMSKFLRWDFEIIFLHWLYHDTLKFSVNYDCIMIQWVSISKMKEAWNGSILLHLSCLYHFGYVHWMYHDTFKLWICIECIMIQSRVKPEILSSNCVLIRKPRTVHYKICTFCIVSQYCASLSFELV